MLNRITFGLLRTPGFWTLLLIVSVLLIQYAGAWYGLEIAKVSKENELQRHLEDLGRIGESTLREAALELISHADRIDEEGTSSPATSLPGTARSEQSENPATPDSEPAVPPSDVEEFAAELAAARRFQDEIDVLIHSTFEQFAASARLNDLILLDDSGRILYSANDPGRLLSQYELLDLDRELLDEALRGEVASSLAYLVGGTSHKRLYVPVRDHNGLVAGVLCLNAGRSFMSELDDLTHYIQLISALSSAFILMIGLLVYRLLVRQKMFERQAAHADRLTSLGSLAAGFAHEVRNPLEIIGASTEDLEKSLKHAADAPPEAMETCRDILEEVERLNRLVSQFLQYSRGDIAPSPKEAAPLGSTLESALAMLKRPADQKRIVLAPAIQASARSAGVNLSEGSLRQIVINIVMNAIQATPEGGTVEIRAEADPRSARIKFTDSGSGIPASVRPRIFEPFFTTRAEGSGLGLAIAHQLAVRAGGKLECENRNGSGGASFVLTLPLARNNGNGGPAA